MTEYNTDDPVAQQNAMDSVLNFYGTRRITSTLYILRECNADADPLVREFCTQLQQVESKPYDSSAPQHPVVKALVLLTPPGVMEDVLETLRAKHIRQTPFDQLRQSFSDLVDGADPTGAHSGLQQLKQTVRQWSL